MKTVRAFPYPGAKMSQVWDLTCFLPDRYEEVIEPFAGSASFSLHLLNHGYVKGHNFWLNDANRHLIDFYRVLQSPADCDQVVIKLLRIQQQHAWVDRFLFNQCVDTLNDYRSSQIDKAVAYHLFMIASYLRKQQFSYSSYTPSVAKATGIPKRRILDLLTVGRLLRKMRLTNESYEAVLAMARDMSFVFLDSPYTTSQDFFSRDAFDLDSYADACKRHKGDCQMMITLDDCEDNRKRFHQSGFIILGRQVYYASTKGKARELMIINYRPPLLEYLVEMAQYEIIENGS